MFNKSKPVYARVVFTFAGEQYEPGDLFEAAPHVVQRMWFARRLTHVGQTDEVKTDEVKTDEVKTDEVKTDEVKTDEVKTDEVSAVTLGHKGAGWYDVLMHGAVMNPEKIKGKQKAIDWAVENLGVTADGIA